VSKLTLMPRNHRGNGYERVGLRIREFAGLSPEEPLDPFSLAEFAKITVIKPAELHGLPSGVLTELLGRSRLRWSGVTLGLSGGRQLCILNPTHNIERIRATLMEEIAHVVLGHRPTRIGAGVDGIYCREYNPANEQTAYGVGAAALVPYSSLFLGVMDGATPASIAKQCGVSPELVCYRIKITMLWDSYKRKAAQAAG